MNIFSGGCFAAAVILTIIGMSMDVTNGSVYNTGLLSERASLFTYGASLLICGSVAAGAATLTSVLSFLKQSNIDSERVPSLQDKTIISAVIVDTPSASTKSATAFVQQEVLKNLTESDFEIADKPKRSRTLKKQTPQTRSIAAYAASHGYRIDEYTFGSVYISKGFATSRVFSSLEKIVSDLGTLSEKDGRS